MTTSKIFRVYGDIYSGNWLDFVELEPGKAQFIFMNPNDPGYTPPSED